MGVRLTVPNSCRRATLHSELEEDALTSTDHEAYKIAALLDRYRVVDGAGFDIERWASDDLPADFRDETLAESRLRDGIARLAAHQGRLYARGTYALLLVFQAMDAGGKDSTIKHVLSGVNPQGVIVTPFKEPTFEELAHDFLWRVHRHVPARGMIGVFNRSHYEEVLITRVHPNLLAAQNLPPQVRDDPAFFEQRLADISAFEAYIVRQGVLVLKFFLNVGLAEQKRRFLERLRDPEKRWKFEAGDLKERAAWSEYRAAYQAAIAATARRHAPWFVVPADRKWFTRLVVVEAINAALAGLDLAPPPLSPEQEAERLAAEKVLEGSNGGS